MSFLHTVPRSFGYAWAGIKTALKNEPNFRVHSVVTIIVILAGVALKLTNLEWLFVTIAISLVITLELINTCIEAIVNMVSPGINDNAKIAKDTSAAAVLIGALTAVVIGILVFIPKLV